MQIYTESFMFPQNMSQHNHDNDLIGYLFM